MATIVGLMANPSPPTTGLQMTHHSELGIILMLIVILMALLKWMMMMLLRIDGLVFVQHGGCNQHRCWNNWLRRGDIMS